MGCLMTYFDVTPSAALKEGAHWPYPVYTALKIYMPARGYRAYAFRARRWRADVSCHTRPGVVGIQVAALNRTSEHIPRVPGALMKSRTVQVLVGQPLRTFVELAVVLVLLVTCAGRAHPRAVIEEARPRLILGVEGVM